MKSLSTLDRLEVEEPQLLSRHDSGMVTDIDGSRGEIGSSRLLITGGSLL